MLTGVLTGDTAFPIHKREAPSSLPFPPLLYLNLTFQESGLGVNSLVIELHNDRLKINPVL